jgi:hypothetical protein
VGKMTEIPVVCEFGVDRVVGKLIFPSEFVTCQHLKFTPWYEINGLSEDGLRVKLSEVVVSKDIF